MQANYIAVKNLKQEKLLAARAQKLIQKEAPKPLKAAEKLLGPKQKVVARSNEINFECQKCCLNYPKKMKLIIDGYCAITESDTAVQIHIAYKG